MGLTYFWLQDNCNEWEKLVFSNITHFNAMQSEVFEIAKNTCENMLVCAPTGAGKTNVALLTICQLIQQNFKLGVLLKHEFKVVYIAPMKALAQEIVGKFQKHLDPLGLEVRECTGDMQLTRTQIHNTQVLVVTPEKWDVITRKNTDEELINTVKLIIIDEVRSCSKHESFLFCKFV
jgi:activating signal cointegrator complex subunit 3